MILVGVCRNYRCLLDITDKTSDLVLGTGSGLKNNLFAVISFLFTVVLANILSDVPLNNIFTHDISVLFEVILIGPFAYLYIINNDAKYKFDRYNKEYENLKLDYKDFLDEIDIEEIFKNDERINKSKNNFYKKKDINGIIRNINLIVKKF